MKYRKGTEKVIVVEKPREETQASSWFLAFMRGVTFFHVAGLALMLLGQHIGERGEYNALGFRFTVTLAEVAGFIAFFRELFKAWIERRKKSNDKK